jgi:hypothetical protein
MVWHGMVWSICPISRPFLVSHAQRGVGAVSLVPSHFLRLVQDACLYCLACPSAQPAFCTAIMPALTVYICIACLSSQSAFLHFLPHYLPACSSVLLTCSAYLTVLPSRLSCLLLCTAYLFIRCFFLHAFACLPVFPACLSALLVYLDCLLFNTVCRSISSVYLSSSSTCTACLTILHVCIVHKPLCKACRLHRLAVYQCLLACLSYLSVCFTCMSSFLVQSALPADMYVLPVRAACLFYLVRLHFLSFFSSYKF